MSLGRYTTWLQMLTSPSAESRAVATAYLEDLTRDPEALISTCIMALSEIDTTIASLPPLQPASPTFSASQNSRFALHQLIFLIFRQFLLDSPSSLSPSSLPPSLSSSTTATLLAYLHRPASQTSPLSLHSCVVALTTLHLPALSSTYSLQTFLTLEPSLFPSLLNLLQSPDPGHATTATLAFTHLLPPLIDILNGDCEDDFPTDLHRTTAATLTSILEMSLQNHVQYSHSSSYSSSVSTELAANTLPLIKSPILQHALSPIPPLLLSSLLSSLQTPTPTTDATIVHYLTLIETAFDSDYLYGIVQSHASPILACTLSHPPSPAAMELAITVLEVYESPITGDDVKSFCDYCSTTTDTSYLKRAFRRIDDTERLAEYVRNALAHAHAHKVNGFHILPPALQEDVGDWIEHFTLFVAALGQQSLKHVPELVVDIISAFTYHSPIHSHPSTPPYHPISSTLLAIATPAALDALGEFIKTAPPAVILQYAEFTLGRCLSLLSHPGPDTRAHAIFVIGCVAHGLAANNSFDRFYTTVTNLLKVALSDPSPAPFLRCKALETLSIIYSTADPTLTKPDVMQYMDTTIRFDFESTDADDEIKSHLLQAWLRMAPLLPPASRNAYLPTIMSTIFQCINTVVTVGGGENAGDSDGDSSDDEGEGGHANTDIRTSAVEEISVGVHSLLLLSESLQESLYDYVAPAIDAIVPHTESPHDDIRAYSIATLAELVRCVAKFPSPDPFPAIRQITELVLQKCVDNILCEDNGEVLATSVQTIKLTLTYAYTPATPSTPPPSLLTREEITTLTEVSVQLLKESLQRQSVQVAEAQLQTRLSPSAAHYDPNCDAEELDIQYVVADFVGSTVCRLFATSLIHETAFNDLLLPFIMQLSRSPSATSRAKIGVCMLDDVLQYIVCTDCMLRSRADELANEASKIFVKCMDDNEDGELAQAATHGLELLAEHYPGALDSAPLIAFVNKVGDPQTTSWREAKENAVKAITMLKNVYV